MDKMNARLIFAILSTTLEEAALAVIVILGLPQVDIYIPLPGLVVMMIAWGAFSVFTYRKGSAALRRKPVTGLPAMIGGNGKVVSPLTPEGTVRVHGELWAAKSIDKDINAREHITVMGQDGLKLIVCRKGDSRKAE